MHSAPPSETNEPASRPRIHLASIRHPSSRLFSHRFNINGSFSSTRITQRVPIRQMREMEASKLRVQEMIIEGKISISAFIHGRLYEASRRPEFIYPKEKQYRPREIVMQWRRWTTSLLIWEKHCMITSVWPHFPPRR